jgi:hypothetical protein
MMTLRLKETINLNLPEGRQSTYKEKKSMMRMFKIESYHPDPDEGGVKPKRPTFIEAETYRLAHEFACKMLGVLEPKNLILSPFAGRLPVDARVFNVNMTFDEIYGSYGPTGLRDACG